MATSRTKNGLQNKLQGWQGKATVTLSGKVAGHALVVVFIYYWPASLKVQFEQLSFHPEVKREEVLCQEIVSKPWMNFT